MLDERGGVNDGHHKPRINVLFWPKYEQLRRADALVISENGLVEIGTEFAIQNISGPECILGALNVRCCALSQAEKTTGGYMLKTNVEGFRSIPYCCPKSLDRGIARS